MWWPGRKKACGYTQVEQATCTPPRRPRLEEKVRLCRCRCHASRSHGLVSYTYIWVEMRRGGGGGKRLLSFRPVCALHVARHARLPSCSRWRRRISAYNKSTIDTATCFVCTYPPSYSSLLTPPIQVATSLTSSSHLEKRTLALDLFLLSLRIPVPASVGPAGTALLRRAERMKTGRRAGRERGMISR